ncbi:titin [Ruminiclostridium sufflavum DSM 19573]|uniref:Titin n=1 Tax=Ruminiclostridium sufflavum DSM 19573 TaxID=1121337 RepID=A0A318XQQ1_9FIRM|nr:titin [Ruminiclostridium sufflavum DSM 19573]
MKIHTGTNRIKKFYDNISRVAFVLAIAVLIQALVLPEKANGADTSNLTVIIYSSASISLNWEDNLTGEKYYVVEKKVDSGTFQTYSSPPPNSKTAYDSAVSAGHTYTYRVWVMNSEGRRYLYTPELSFRTDEVAKPTSLTLTPVSYNQIDISWGYADNKAYNTIIERRTESGTEWIKLASIGIGQNTYSDKSISSGTKYYYRVRACSGSTESVKSAAYPEEGKTAYSYLYKPTDFYGIALSGYSIKLNWTDNSSETAFIIERKSPKSGEFEEIAVVPQNNNSYIDSDAELEAGVTYQYRIRAVSGTTNSEYSDTISVTNTYLKAPGILSSSCTDGKNIQLAWEDLTDNETGFEVWRKTGSNTVWELYETMGRNATSFTDQNISLQDTYTYKVRAKINDNSVYSDFTNVTTVWSVTIAAPSDLTYEVVGAAQVNLHWKDSSMSEAGYNVERKQGLSGKWYTIGYLEEDVVSYIDKWVNTTDVYFYRIKVYDKSNSINYSNEIAVSLKTPEAPTNLQANPISSSEIKLTWEDNSFNETEFVIEAMQFYSFREIGRVSANTTTFTQQNLVSDVTVTYRVSAVTGSNRSSTSNEVVASAKKYITYSDVSSVKWAETAISNLASRGIFDTKAGSKFYPSQNITMGEYCAIIIRSLDLGMVPAGRYADVTSKHKYYKEIMSAAKLGIISPDKDNRLYPDKAASREQAGLMLLLAMKAKGTPFPDEDGGLLKQFADYRTISANTADKIADVCAAGILSGRIINGEVYLQLSGKVTRAEAAVIAYKAINLYDKNM